jgi:hypothetical protein
MELSTIQKKRDVKPLKSPIYIWLLRIFQTKKTTYLEVLRVELRSKRHAYKLLPL